jgi:uncharacterized protein (TIGR03086 family)
MSTARPAQLADVLAVTEQVVSAIRPGQWSAPTPCSEWRVRDLVDHLVLGNRMLAGVLAGHPLQDEAARLQATDQLGADPTSAYRQAGETVLAAFRRPGALDDLVSVPFGSVPGEVALHLRITEMTVHGWDLARAIDVPVCFPVGVVEQELQFSREALGTWPAGDRRFAPPYPVDDDAPTLDRLVALLGRSPG